MTDVVSKKLPKPSRWKFRLSISPALRKRVLRYLPYIGITVVIALVGLQVRLWAWHATAPIRFNWDLNNAWGRGTDALERGNGNFFDGVVEMYKPENETGIDYPPLRMYIKTAWVRYIRNRYGPDVQRDDSVMYPMLAVNFVFEFAGALGMYFLCRLRAGRAGSLIAACCLWFNPAVIFNTFCWPQWDIWLIGPLIWAIWTIYRTHTPRGLLIDFFGGLMLGLALMLKGQVAIVALWFPLVLIGLAVFEPRPFGRAIARWPQRVLLRCALAVTRVAIFFAGAAVTVFAATLPFTLRHSVDWINVYIHETRDSLPMYASGWNLPRILADRYGWRHISEPWTVHIFGMSRTMELKSWLIAAFAICLVASGIMSIVHRARPQTLLGPGIAFAAMFAFLPGMHERYVFYAAALLAPCVLVGPTAIMLYILITALALGCQMQACLNPHPDILTGLHDWMDKTQIDLGYAWIFATLSLLYLTMFFWRNRRRKEVVKWSNGYTLKRWIRRAR